MDAERRAGLTARSDHEALDRLAAEPKLMAFFWQGQAEAADW
jgi:hypothetical protein